MTILYTCMHSNVVYGIRMLYTNILYTWLSCIGYQNVVYMTIVYRVSEYCIHDYLVYMTILYRVSECCIHDNLVYLYAFECCIWYKNGVHKYIVYVTILYRVSECCVHDYLSVRILYTWLFCIGCQNVVYIRMLSVAYIRILYRVSEFCIHWNLESYICIRMFCRVSEWCIQSNIECCIHSNVVWGVQILFTLDCFIGCQNLVYIQILYTWDVVYIWMLYRVSESCMHSNGVYMECCCHLTSVFSYPILTRTCSRRVGCKNIVCTIFCIRMSVFSYGVATISRLL